MSHKTEICFPLLSRCFTHEMMTGEKTSLISYTGQASPPIWGTFPHYMCSAFVGSSPASQALLGRWSGPFFHVVSSLHLLLFGPQVDQGGAFQPMKLY
jgi:hypothetical protein